MAIKTAAEIFGDGSGGNPQVPIDLNNPPGFNANNRGTAFGEQVTSAIKNRTPYALALNDEDLNTRLALFEVGGIDTAYDLGGAAVPGGGRQVTKDAGAIETISALSASYADDIMNAHFRANMLNDTVAGSTGFDASSLQNNSNGFVDRQRFPTFATSNTLVNLGEAALLNPGGALPTTVRLTGGGSFHNAGTTELPLGVDFVEVIGSASDDGLYFVASLGGTDPDAVLQKIDGTSPTFTSNEAITVNLHRTRIRTHDYVDIVGGPGSGVADTLRIYPNRHYDDSDEDEGAFRALSVFHRADDGTAVRAMEIDWAGRYIHSLDTSDLDAADVRNQFMGVPTTFRELASASVDAEASHVVLSSVQAAPGTRLDFLGLHALTDADHVFGGTITYKATSPTNGRVDGTSVVGGPDWGLGLYPGATVVRIASGNGQGWYFLKSIDESVPDELVLLNLDGTLPSHFPVSGTAPVQVYAPQALGRYPQMPVADIGAAAGGWEFMTPYATLASGDETDAVALALHAANRTGANNALIRGFQGEAGGGSNAKEVFRVERTGAVLASASIQAEGDVKIEGSGGEFNYNTARSKERDVPLGQAVVDTNGTAQWQHASASGVIDRLNSLDNANNCFVPLLLPVGVTLTLVEAIVQMGATRAAAGDRVQLAVKQLVQDWSSPFNQTVNDLSALQSAVDNTNKQLLPSAAMSHTVVQDAVYYVQLLSGNDGGAHQADSVFAVRAVFDDPGPRI
jgi:hypothetical protein